MVMIKQERDYQYKLISPVVIALFFVLINTIAFSQNEIDDPPPITWGEIDTTNFKITNVDFSPDASSLTICKYGQVSSISNVDGSIGTETDIHERFIILTDEGINRANIEIPFYTGRKKRKKIRKLNSRSYTSSKSGQSVENIRAIVYNIDDEGNIDQSVLDKDQIFVTDYSDIANYGIISLALNNVKVGSIVDFNYTISDNHALYTKKWLFQSAQPCLHNEIRLQVINNISYATIRKGLLAKFIEMMPSNLTFEDNYRMEGDVYKYSLDSIPGLEDEPFVTSIDNYRTHILVQINRYYSYSLNRVVEAISTWPKLAEELLTDPKFGKQIKRYRMLFGSLHDVYSTAETDEEIAKQCYNYVSDYFSCNNKESIHATNNLDDVYESAIGSESEINLFLCALLNSAGINSNMALVSTRDNGYVNENFPFYNQFNYVLCMAYVNGDTIFLDASTKKGNFNYPPDFVVGSKAFPIKKNNTKFIEITTKGKYDKFVSITEELSQDSIFGKIQIRFKGYAAVKERIKFDDKTDNYLESTLNADDNLQLYKSEIFNSKNANKPMMLSTEYTLYDNNFGTTELYYLNPFTAYGDFKNEFKSERRYFPVEFNFPINITYLYSIKIPTDYEVVDLPKNSNKALSNNTASVSIFYQPSGNFIQVKTQLKINSIIFSPSDYANLKTLFDEWELKHNEMIVLKKISQ